MFKTGDKIKCIEAGINTFIETGKVYTFMKYKDEGFLDKNHPEKIIYLVENPIKLGFFQKRFRKVLNKSPEEWL